MQYDEMVERYKNDLISFIIDFGSLYNTIDDNSEFSFDGIYGSTKDLLWLFQKSNKTIVAKKRRQGVSWNLIAFAAWHMLMNPRSRVVLATCNKDMMNIAYSRMKFFLESLSDNIEYDLNDPSEEKAFLDMQKPFVLFNDSVFTVLTSKSNALSNVLADVLLIDEVQALPYQIVEMMKTLFWKTQKAIMIGTMFMNEFDEHETWFDAYVNNMQFVDDVRVVRL